jgi:poly-gamma-glutamate synthesis protein (capsule biosynthesis protein)
MITEKTKKIILFLFFIILGFLSASFVFSQIEGNHITQKVENPKASVIDAIKDTPEKPTYLYVNKNNTTKPKVSADSYIVGDLGTGEIILNQNADKKLPIASMSKLMTALVAKEISKDGDVTRVSKKAVATSGGNGELKVGEKIKVNDLVYPLLLESSNDAAEAIAEYFKREEFINKMNVAAKSLKMDDTSFEDPSGLSKNNMSTALDIFKLTGYLNKEKPDIIQITKKPSYSIGRHHWSNISQFLGNSAYLGGKSGYTDKAGQTVVSVFSLPVGENISRPIAITLLHSKDRKKDVESILKYIKKNIYYGGVADINTDWVKEKLSIPEEEQNFIDMIFGGDLMLDRGVKSSVNKNFSGNYSTLFTKMNILKEADIVFANLEGTISDKGSDLGNLYSFRMDPSIAPTLKSAGFTILSVANNHVGDWGRLAYIDSLNRLKENEILYTGGGMTSIEAETPTIIEKYDMKIGFLGFSDVGPKYMETGVDKAGLLLASNPRFEEIISNASKQVDYLIVSFHFGDEYKKTHNQRQEELAHKAIDNGAKIVVGHHPHVIEDTEVYKDGYIMYSLGNLLFDQKFSTDTMQGMLVQIKLNKNGTMSVVKNTTYQNAKFQIEKIIKGKEEFIKPTNNTELTSQ